MKKATFANIIIAVCVAVSLGITAAVVYEYHRLDTVLPSGVVTVLLGLWGGELLIIALRQRKFHTHVYHLKNVVSKENHFAPKMR